MVLPNVPKGPDPFGPYLFRAARERLSPRTHVEGTGRWDAGAMSTTTSSNAGTPATSTAVRVVSDLVSAGLVPPSRATEAEAVVSGSLRLPEQPPPSRGGAGLRLAEIAGYAGGALVLAAVGLVLATGWNDLSEAAQVVVLVIISALLATAGLVAGKVGGGYAELRDGRDEVRRRLTSALLNGAALAGALTVGRLVEVAGEQLTPWPGFAGGLTAVALAAAAYRVAPSALGQLVLVGGAATAITSGLELLGSDNATTLAPGLAILALGVVWLALVELDRLAEPVVGRFLGVALAFTGAQITVFDHAWLAYVLTLLVAAAGFALYLRTVSWPYLVVGVLGITVVVPEAVLDWTDGSLGVAGGVLVAGLTLLGASLAGLRVKQEVTD
jgi:hypothetical protein